MNLLRAAFVAFLLTVATWYTHLFGLVLLAGGAVSDVFEIMYEMTHQAPNKELVNAILVMWLILTSAYWFSLRNQSAESPAK